MSLHLGGKLLRVDLTRDGDTITGTVLSEREPHAEDQRRTIGDLARGAIGVAQEAAGRNVADRATATARWEVCTGCEHFDLGFCRKCSGCAMSIKARRADARCPIGKWA